MPSRTSSGLLSFFFFLLGYLPFLIFLASSQSVDSFTNLPCDSRSEWPSIVNKHKPEDDLPLGRFRILDKLGSFDTFRAECRRPIEDIYDDIFHDLYIVARNSIMTRNLVNLNLTTQKLFLILFFLPLLLLQYFLYVLFLYLLIVFFTSLTFTILLLCFILFFTN